MCGGAIISDFAPPSRSSHRLTADLLWNTPLKKSPNNYYSKPLRSGIVDLDNDFEADFQGFMDFSGYEVEARVKPPFAFSASKSTRGKPFSFTIVMFSFILGLKFFFFFPFLMSILPSHMMFVFSVCILFDCLNRYGLF